ncbi:uncharacterized protein LOC144543639 [Carex rostrata]
MSGDGTGGTGLECLGKIDPEVLKVLVGLIQGASASTKPAISAPAQVPVKLDLQNVELKLDGSATYLSWSRRVKRALSGRNLEGYLTGEKGEPTKDSVEHNEWKTTHSLLHTWLLNSMVASIAVTVDGIEAVSDVWGKLQRIYAGADNNLRVFQIEREIEAVAQRERSIQEYAADLERLWADYDHFSPPACCNDPECKKGDDRVQRRTMHFMRGLNPAFEPRCAVLLAQPKIPSLDEAISAMIQEESRMGLQAGAGGLSQVKSALAVSNSGNTEYRGETRQCYNCGEVGHLKQACPKLPKERDTGGRGQFGSRGRSRRGRRGGRGGNRAHLMVAEEEEEAGRDLTEEDQALLDKFSQMLRKQKAVSVGDSASTSSGSKGNFALFAQSATGDLPGEEDGQEARDWYMA